MSEQNQEEIEDLKILYYDVIKGSSFFPEHKLYIKHFNEFDNIKNLIYKKQLIKEYKRQGLYTEKEKEKYLIDNNLWTQEKQDRILQLKYIVFDNEKQLEKLVIPAQKASIQKLVDQDKEELKRLENDLSILLEPTCESMAVKEAENYLIYLSCSKDQESKNLYWEESEFDQIDESLLIKYKILFRLMFQKTSSNTIQKIACMPFFLNALRAADKKADAFFGKPSYELTYAQQDLFFSGLRNTNVLSNTDGPPPNLIDHSIDDLAKWYDLQYSILSSKAEKH
jgi:hypothetical protein